MRVAFLVRHFPKVSETFVLNQITGLIDRGHEVDIFAESSRDEIVHPDIERYGLVDRTVYWPTVPKLRFVRWLKGLVLLLGLAVFRPRAAIVAANVSAYGRLTLTMNLAYAAWPIRNRRRYDVIQCHFGENGVLGMALRDMGLLDGTLVTSFHGYDLSMDLRRRGTHVYSRLFRVGNFFLPVSERWHQRLIELGCPREKLAVHRMGIDTRRFMSRSRGRSSDGQIRLVSVARLVEKKGIEYAIRAVADVMAQGHQVAYTVVGDGPLAGALAALVAELQLDGVVHLAGSRTQPDVITILDGAHLLLMPSVTASDGDEEGIPVVLMEAMAMGVPVIATRHSGIPELVEDGVSGRLVAERDPRALAAAIIDVADHPDLAAEFARAGRDRVLAQHDIEKLNDSLVALYQRLTG